MQEEPLEVRFERYVQKEAERWGVLNDRLAAHHFALVAIAVAASKSSPDVLKVITDGLRAFEGDFRLLNARADAIAELRELREHLERRPSKAKDAGRGKPK